VEWLVKAGLDGLFGLALGLVLIPVVKYAMAALRVIRPARTTRPAAPLPSSRLTREPTGHE
jgi:hypothetical protein